MLKKILRKITPRFILSFYHWSLAQAAASIYGYPSRQMVVIGVTGTGGKSTVVNLIGRILEEAGYQVGWTTTCNFKIAGKEWTNKTKMTMLGRFSLQKLLKQMVEANCQYAIIETSSEGIAQSRHVGIDYDLVVFNNLFPEHLERHGGFDKYRAAKGKLFAGLMVSKKKNINGQKVKKISVVNWDDQNADYFNQFWAEEKWGFSISESGIKNKELGIRVVLATDIKIKNNGAEFMVDGQGFKINLLGEFNVANALAAIAVAFTQSISLEICAQVLEKVNSLEGRMEVIQKQPFMVVVDYAHTPDELEKVYQSLKIGDKELIGVLGSAGGGRDRWKRPEFGRISSQYCREIIITNEDPYDEDPQKIIDEVAEGVKDNHCYRILDRRQAIQKAVELAKSNDVVIITGKGSEQCIMGPNGQKIPWNDRQVVEEIIQKLKSKNQR